MKSTIKNNISSKALAVNIIKEATTDQIIEGLVEQAVSASLGDASFDVLAQDFPQAKQDYYMNIRKSLAKQLDVEEDKVGHYVTETMKVFFAKALEDAHKKAVSIQDGQQQDQQQEEEPPELLTEN